MTYRITFKERTNAAGEPTQAPSAALDAQTPEGVILDKSFLSRDEPLALHNEENLEEDDSFLSVGSETWDYEIVDGKETEFLDAVKTSEVTLECFRIDDRTGP